ncbi:probable calcium-binding protein CML27 [Diospyros lotus]|uniref:probable calcium-binding protein CML27 n=1 Tax=Diospyros lotus TaxID=55363 RepID=UPI0022546EC6|nr:probable calcium-binding protein CML27 [Diospyros lotus]
MAMATNGEANPVPKPSVYLDDMEELRNVFKRFDANGDGKISVTELVQVMDALGSNTSESEVKRMMEEIDTDRDGFINLDEFASFCKSAGHGDDGVRELKEAFELYDQNKNGLISATELHQILNRLGEKCSVQDCTRMIQTVDSDGDGHVSFEEFKKMMSKKSNLSSNGDSC